MDAIGIFVARLLGTVASSFGDAASALAPAFLASLLPVAVAAWRGRRPGLALALTLLADGLFLFDAAYGRPSGWRSWPSRCCPAGPRCGPGPLPGQPLPRRCRMAVHEPWVPPCDSPPS